MACCWWLLYWLGATAEVNITVHSRWPEVAPGRRHTQALVVELTPPAVGTIPPQELALVVDVSLTMAQPLTMVKSVVRQIIHALRSEDRIHLISFHSFARAEFINGSLALKAELLEALDALVPKTNLSIRPIDGSDPVGQDVGNISEGLWIAQRLLLSPIASTQSATRRAMIFTDGQLRGGVSRHAVALDALERARVAGVPTTVVALGPSYSWLQEAAKVAHGDFIHLHGPEGFQQVVAAAAASYFPTFATNAKLRLATSFGAKFHDTYGHRRRREHQRPWAEPLVQGQGSTDDELKLGSLRHGRTERLMLVLDLPSYNKGFDLLKYELLYQVNGTSMSQWEQFTQHVAATGTSPVASPAADLLFRLDELLWQREELRRDEELAEAQELPVPRYKGDGSRWSRLSERWRSLVSALESLAAEAAASQKDLPSLSQFSIVEQVWAALETTKLAGRGLVAASGTGRTAASFGLCEGAPQLCELPRTSLEGLSLPNSR